MAIGLYQTVIIYFNEILVIFLYSFFIYYNINIINKAYYCYLGNWLNTDFYKINIKKQKQNRGNWGFL